MKRSAILALALYAAFLLGIAVWRPWTTPAAPFSERWELVPFTGTADLWRAGIVPFVFLFVGNVACFVPFGFGLPALTPLRRAVVPLCLLGSLLIEVLQWAFGTGVPQVEDVLLNTLGAALGYALFHAVNPVTRSPAADESHAESAEGAESESHAESAEGAESESHAENAEGAESESHAENAESAESEFHAESAESTML